MPETPSQVECPAAEATAATAHTTVKGTQSHTAPRNGQQQCIEEQIPTAPTAVTPPLASPFTTEATAAAATT